MRTFLYFCTEPWYKLTGYCVTSSPSVPKDAYVTSFIFLSKLFSPKAPSFYLSLSFTFSLSLLLSFSLSPLVKVQTFQQKDFIILGKTLVLCIFQFESYYIAWSPKNFLALCLSASLSQY